MKAARKLMLLSLWILLPVVLGSASALAATISLDLVGSQAFVDVSVYDPIGWYEDNDAHGGYASAYAKAELPSLSLWAESERHGTSLLANHFYTDPDGNSYSYAAVTLYGSHAGAVAAGIADGGGDIHQQYTMRVQSDFMAGGHIEAITDVNIGNPFFDGDAFFYVVDPVTSDPIFEWHADEGDSLGNSMILEYGVDYLIDAYLGFGFQEEFNGDFMMGYSPGIVIKVAEAQVPIPSAAWLIGSALVGLAGIIGRNRGSHS